MSTQNPTDTAHLAWDAVWQTDDGSEEWGTPEPAVTAEAARLRLAGAQSALDVGAGVGRHALALAALGFKVSAFDRSRTGLERIKERAAERGLAIETGEGAMTALPFADGAFDYVLAWNVIYHGDPDVVRQAAAEIARVTRRGGVFQGTLLSKRRADFGRGVEIAPDTFVQPDAAGDKSHPHFFIGAADVPRLFPEFEVRALIDVDDGGDGSWHWNVIAERR